MSILSLDYLLLVAVAFLTYYLLPLKVRWWALLTASLVFYTLAGWFGLIYLTAVAAVTWGGGLAIRRVKAEGRWARAGGAKPLLAGVLALILGAMAALKYGGLWTAGWIVPLGLSWFTFQSAGYVIDVYSGKVEPERNPCRYLLFVAFFPQMTQGPVSTWKQLAPQLTEGHRLEPALVQEGVLLMLWGYFKKLVLADRLAAVAAYTTTQLVVPGWLALASAGVYMVQLYADFSGGMDMIRGTALLYGIRMTENFRRPFFSTSVAEYWRRWHISLGAWFRSYLLYPLTTSRLGLAVGTGASRLLGKKMGRLIPSALATILIFVLIGLWHGASWNAAIYGMYFGVVMAVSMLMEPWFRQLRKRWHVREKHPAIIALRLTRTWLLVLLAQFFAFTAGPREAFSLMGQSLMGWSVANVGSVLTAIMPGLEWIIVLAALTVLTAVDALDEQGLTIGQRLARGPFPLRWLAMLALIVAIVVLGCYGDGMNGAAFLYTQF